MVATPYPVARDFRRTDVLVGNGGTVYSGFGFKIFDVRDVAVYLKRSTDAEFAVATVTVSKAAALDYDDFSIAFASAITAADQYFVIGATAVERTAGVTKGTKIDPDQVEREFSRIAMMLNELRRDLERAVQASPAATETLMLGEGIADNEVLIKLGNRIIGGELLNVASPTDGATVIVALAAKADLSYVNSALALKANSDAVQDIASRGQLATFRDKMINGDGQINQLGVTSASDDTYAWDQHNVLTQSASVGTSTIRNVADDVPAMMRLTQTSATAQRMANTQILEAIDVAPLRGKVMTLLGKLRSSNTGTLKYAVLEWTGTADVVVSDVVNDWTAAALTAGNFFIGSNLVVNQIGTLVPAANTLTSFALKATISSAAKNLILMAWTADPAAQNTTIDLTWRFLLGDATGESWQPPSRPRAIEEALCRRYVHKTFDIDVAPAHNQGETYGLPILFNAGGTTCGTQYKISGRWDFGGHMRVPPSVTKYSVSPVTSQGGNANDIANLSVATEYGLAVLARTEGVMFSFVVPVSNLANPYGVYAVARAQL